MANDLLQAKVIATGDVINVYKHKERNVFVEYPGCKVEYKPEALAF